jgi:sulfur transfer protein SufE/stress-induced morphogen
MKSLAVSFLCLALPFSSAAFAFVQQTRLHACRPALHQSSDTSTESWTPELAKLTKAFESIGDDKLRYKQLLFMANQLQDLDASKQTPDNLVPGCLSTVYIDATVQDDNGVPLVYYKGTSDGVLTKGLVAFLIRGLSGNTADEIKKVDPSFIHRAGITASLTPGRNNGFLNMLAVMKNKAVKLSSEYAASSQSAQQQQQEQQQQEQTTAVPSSSSTPRYDAILSALQKLQPADLVLKDVSYKHANHAAMKGIEGGESHFDLYIVADAFDGLNLVKRHKLIYMLLGEVMPQIHALQIRSLTPAEADKQK